MLCRTDDVGECWFDDLSINNILLKLSKVSLLVVLKVARHSRMSLFFISFLIGRTFRWIWIRLLLFKALIIGDVEHIGLNRGPRNIGVIRLH